MSLALLKSLPNLKKWYGQSARVLPWRIAKPDPYHVWIAEVMSQQSTMVSMLPYFKRWLERFPTVEALASASEVEVLSAWTGLGYYSRARNVHKSAKILTTRCRSAKGWPRIASDWQSLPGVGPYTAAAVAAIAFDDSVLPVDGNVIRVVARFYGVANPLNQRADLEKIHKSVHDFASKVPRGEHSRIAQALMELGSQICRPGHLALCALCPLKERCQAFKTSRVAEIPQAKARPATIPITQLALIYRNSQQALLLRQIPTGARLAGHWEVPLMKWQGGLGDIARHFDLRPKAVTHSITRYRFKVHAVEAGPWPSSRAPRQHVFWQPDSVPPGPLTTLTRKLLLKYEAF